MQAEESIIAAAILDPTGEAIDIFREIISPEDFYANANQLMMRAILAIRDRGEGVDIVTVKAELASKGQLDDAGGPDKIDWIANFSLRANAQFADNAEVIFQLAQKRRCQEAGRLLSERGYDPTESAEGMFEAFSKSLNSIAERMGRRKDKPKTIADHVRNVARLRGQGVELSSYIGIPNLDAATRGVARGENVVIGGMTGHGKTLVAAQNLHQASERGVPGLFITREMTGDDLGSRILGGMTTVPEDLWQQESATVLRHVDEFYANRAPIFVAESPTSISDVEKVIQWSVKEHKIGIVALDYVQLVKGDGQNREQQVGDVSRRFKQCLLKHRIVGLLLSQLNREPARLGRMPILSDLRDSGSVEQDADIVVFAYWEAKCNPKADANLYRLIIAKNRKRGIQSPIVEMRIDPYRQWLFPIEPEDQWEAARR